MTRPETSRLPENSITSKNRGRWLVLGLSAFSLTGNYFAYDIPAALNGQLRVYLDSNYYDWQYSLALMYIAYSIPNIFLPLTIGRLVETYGRGLLGVGGESLGVAQAQMTYHWFSIKELGFALGVNLCFARFGSVINDVVSPYIATNHGGVLSASCFGLVMCLVSGICAVFFVLADYVGEAQVRLKIHQRLATHSATNKRYSDQLTSAENGNIRCSYLSGLSDGFSLFGDRVDQPMRLSDIYRFPTEYWILCCIMVCFYGSTIPFINIGSDLLQQKWLGQDPITAGALLSIPDLVSTLLLPFSGLLMHFLGFRMVIMVFCAGIIGTIHWSFAFTEWSPLPGLIGLGCMSAVYATYFWPTISLFIDEVYLPTAYAVATTLLNAFLSIAPLVVALLVNKGHQYVWVEGFFCGVILVGLVGLLALWFFDTWWGNAVLAESRCRQRSYQENPDFSDSEDDYFEETEEVYGDSEANTPENRIATDTGREKTPLIHRVDPPTLYGTEPS
ncbi:MFS general substrate transporter [Basidiobolus meristosporus CBS 931.73]|uniref:MFS general substrate transporter n=1 Tax=Basidiobolus meristosporus CBS 931.73 TaxID=1314790 RepID=A0A1Y1YWK5_9FUNG|nr:MFS general substrate transporter [Basidiobolus meristosporus CBS 931.73]|eukprot:ORY02420.1 MFS general substrate transporter [Basidiobolus meristosporus CBS 931.73]